MSAIRLTGLVASVLLLGCVTPPQFYALEREVAELKAARTGVSVPGGGDERVAELGTQVDALHDEVARLRGAVEEAKYLAEQSLKEVRQSREGQAPQAAADAVPMVDPQSVSAELRSYDEAFAVYRSGEYEAAIDRFGSFLQAYPDSDHSDNALFWIGECYFKLKDYERAVLTFEDVVNRFPDGNKVPDALFRQGIALLEIGKQTQEQERYNAVARQIFERIVRDYPDSERVPEAQRKLGVLGQ